MKYCKSILFLMSVLALCSGELFAAGAKVVARSDGGRITIVSKLEGAATAPNNASDAGLVKIYNNIGAAYKKAKFWCCEGASVSGSQTGAQWWDAVAFTPSENRTVTRVELALGYIFGTNEVVISLTNDANGVPGSAIQSWTVQNIPGAGLCCTLVVQTADPGIPVTAGTQYWITATTSSDADDLDAVWDVNSTNEIDSALSAARCTGPLCPLGGEPWTAVQQSPGLALAVLGK